MYKKIILILIIISFVWIWKDYKKIDTGFVNQSSITYSYDNLNSNVLNDYFDKKEISNLLKSHDNNYNDNSSLLWSILVFKKWIEYK